MVISELVSLLGFSYDNSGARRFDAELDRMARRADSVTAGIAAGMTNALAGAAFGLAERIGGMIGASLMAIPKAGDAMTSAVGRIQGSIAESAISGGEAVAIYEKLYEIGTRTGISANESAQAFARIQLAMQELDRPVSDTLELLEGVQSAGIAAGASTEDVNEAIRQLGQSLGKGKLNGDELVSLMERMPSMMHGVRKEMGMTTAEFFKASETGKLTPELLIPALLKSGEKARADLAKFPLTMGRGFAVMRNAAQRFLAEIDKALGISQGIARVFMWIAGALDRWRAGVSAVGDLVDRLGGLEAILRLAGAALLAIIAPTVLGSLGAMSGLFVALAGGAMRFALVLAGIVSWALIIEDFIGWIQGKDSLFGERFGEFNVIFDGVKERIKNVKDALDSLGVGPSGIWDAIKTDSQETWDLIKKVFDGIKTAGEGIPVDFRGIWQQVKSVTDEFVNGFLKDPERIKAAFSALKDYFSGLFASIESVFNSFVDKITSIWTRLTAIFSSGAAAPAASGGGGGGLSGFLARNGWGFRDDGSNGGAPNADLSNFFRGAITPDVSGRMAGAGGNTSVQAPVDADIHIVITAPAGDPASIGSAARSGVMSGMAESGARLGDTLARGLGIAAPRVEAPAAP